LACDHYERFDEDFRLAASLGHTAQRISVEWSRLEPEAGRFDEREFDHYRAVCDSIRHYGMAPTVTLHHFTNPVWVERQGGWENPRTGGWLARLPERVGRALGNRVAVWWTINEPMIAPLVGYILGAHPPAVRDLPRALVVARHTLRAHGAMYRALRGVVATGVPVGAVHHLPFLAPLARLGKPLMVTENGHATLDEAARTRYLHVHLGELHAAVAAGVDVRGYFYWSLMDNFEWAEGYTRHFGLVAIEPGTLLRRPRP